MRRSRNVHKRSWRCEREHMGAEKKIPALTGISLKWAMMAHMMNMPETMMETMMTGLRQCGEGQHC